MSNYGEFPCPECGQRLDSARRVEELELKLRKKEEELARLKKYIDKYQMPIQEHEVG